MNDQEQPVVDYPGRSDGSLGSEGGKSGNVSLIVSQVNLKYSYCYCELFSQ